MIDLDGDGIEDRTLAVGAHWDDDGGVNRGAVWLLFLEGDTDGDGITDDVDVCSGTEIPESVPTVHLGMNRWALVDEDTIFDTTSPPGGGTGPSLSFTVEDTTGCSCEQIIEKMELGQGHTKFGCSTGAMVDWVLFVLGAADSENLHAAGRVEGNPSDPFERQQAQDEQVMTPWDLAGRQGTRSRLSTMNRSAAGSKARMESEASLLADLGRTADVEARLRIVRELVGKVDVAMNALLLRHLQDIRGEAATVGRPDLAAEAERLSRTLERSRN